MPPVVSSRVMCEWVNMVAQVLVGQVIMAAGMGRMRVNLLWEGAYWGQCLTLRVCAIVMKMCLQGDMRALASVVCNFDIMVSLVHILQHRH
jgi:hypothetical protein